MYHDQVSGEHLQDHWSSGYSFFQNPSENSAVAEQTSLSFTWSQIPKTGCLMTWFISYYPFKSVKKHLDFI